MFNVLQSFGISSLFVAIASLPPAHGYEAYDTGEGFHQVSMIYPR